MNEYTPKELHRIQQQTKAEYRLRITREPDDPQIREQRAQIREELTQ